MRTKWTWVKFRDIASRCVTRGDLVRINRAAYEAGRRNGWLDRHFGAKTRYKRDVDFYYREPAQ